MKKLKSMDLGTTNGNKIIKKYDILKSKKVEHDNGHAHKIWWMNVEQRPDGKYQVITYAQLFRIHNNGVIQGDEVRKYECRIFSTAGAALTDADNRIAKKKSNYKGYEFFKTRSEISIDVTQEVIEEFLLKYGKR